VRYFSAQRALNFLYHQDDSGLYEHNYVAISTREDFEELQKDLDLPSFKNTMASLCSTEPARAKLMEEFFA